MKYLKLSKTFPDGRVLTYHKVHDIIQGPENISDIRLGSWTFFRDMSSGGIPEYITSNIITGNPEIFVENLLETLLTQPEWQGAELHDTSIPVEALEQTGLSNIT